MNGASKCGQCMNKENCHIRIHLNNIIRDAIKNAEKEVESLSPKEIDYMIVTDISVIPTRCSNYICRDNLKERSSETDRFFYLGKELAPTAV